VGFNGGEPFSFADIESWIRLTGVQVLREEFQILMRMDRAYIGKLAALSKDYKVADRHRPDPRQEDPVLADRTNEALTPAIFDSLF
jgi:hypothetical protein